jgi:hypothetical protein
MRIIIILSGRVRMRIIIKTVQMYQKVRLGAKSAIYRSVVSPKIFKPLRLFSKQANKQDSKQPRQWNSEQFFTIEIISTKLIVI